MADDVEAQPEEVPGEEAARISPEDARRAAEIMKRMERIRSSIRRTEGLAKLLDKGRLDPILGALLPEFGDILTAGASLYIVGEGIHAGLPAEKILKMLLNIGIDVGIGLIPVLGDIFDWFWHSNVKNVEIMKQYADELKRRHDQASGARK